MAKVKKASSVPSRHGLFYKKPMEGGEKVTHPEFIIPIDKEMFAKWKTSNGSVAMTHVVNTTKVFASLKGTRTGKLDLPSNQLLDEYFGTSKFEKIFEFMAENGRVMNANRHSAIFSSDKEGGNMKSRRKNPKRGR